MRSQINMSSGCSAVCWPAVLCMEQSNELVYLSSETALFDDVSLLERFNDKDVIIDSAGNRFPFGKGKVYLTKPECIYVKDFVTLLQKHINTTGQCCAAKANCQTVAQGIEMIAQMEDC